MAFTNCGLARTLLIAIVAFLTNLQTCRADIALWYNGDFNGGSSPGNIAGATFNPNQTTFDDFIVPSSVSSWTVRTVWSKDLIVDMPPVSQADWSIRSGVSAGHAGALIASGNSTASQTATGRLISGLTEYTIQVTGLNVQLAPGTYWLNVTPITSDGQGVSYDSATSGFNAIGAPPGNDGSVFVTSDTNFFLPFPGDVSMGVAGTASVPEPTCLLLTTTGLGALVLRFRKYNREHAHSRD